MTLWDELSKRTFLSREYARKAAYGIAYGGRIDPWLDHIVRTELAALLPHTNLAIEVTRH